MWSDLCMMPTFYIKLIDTEYCFYLAEIYINMVNVINFDQFEPQQMELCSSQPFLAKLQPLIKEENTTVVEDVGKTETGNKNEVNANFPIGDLEEEEKHKDCDIGDVKKTQVHFDPEVVQIKAGKAEVRSWVLGGQGSIF